MSEEKGYFEIIDNKFWILTVRDTGMIAFQKFEDAIKQIFGKKDGFEQFVIDGTTLYEFLFEDRKFIVKNVLLPDMVKEWYRITGREKVEEKEYTQRPAGYEGDHEETTKRRQDQEVN